MNNNAEPVHWIKLIFDVSSTILMVMFFQIIKVVAKPFKSSFYCNDYSINMPFKTSTVNNLCLILISLVMPIIMIISTEIVRTIYKSCYLKKNRNSYIYKIKLYKSRVLQIPEQIGNLYVNVGSFFFGYAVTAVITDLTKVVVGRLRPNFLSVCKPNVNPYTELCGKNKTFLIPGLDFRCTSSDIPSIEDSRMSFPSGHSSLSFYSMIFLIMYINFSWNCRRFGLFPRLIQFMLFVVASFTALSRIVDNKHHPTDVLTGAFLGTVISIFSFVYLTDFLKKNNYKFRYYSLRDRNFDEENLQPSLPSNTALNGSNISDRNMNQSYNNYGIRNI